MFKQIKMVIIILLIFSLAGVFSTSQADLESNWQETLKKLQPEAEKQLNYPAVELTPAMLEKFQQETKEKSIEIGIAYDTEKEEWLRWASEEFNQTEIGKDINIKLIPMGVIEGAETLLKKDFKAQLIHVWTPANHLSRGFLENEWQERNQDCQEKNCDNPILSGIPLVYTPMVIILWEERYKAFIAKYGDLNFNTIAQAMSEQTGWAAIADKPEWGIFTFSCTIPTYSNSGLLTLILMVYNYYYSPQSPAEELTQERIINLEHIKNNKFVTWFRDLQGYILSEQTNTHTLMQTLLNLGATEMDAITVYENLALNYLGKKPVAKSCDHPEEEDCKPAAKKFPSNKLTIVYPFYNIWNDNPYYILNVPWSDETQRTAAKLFQNFLLSKSVQEVARDEYAFRPANRDVPLLKKGNIFDQFQNTVQQSHNLKNILIPETAVLKQLIKVWENNNN